MKNSIEEEKNKLNNSLKKDKDKSTFSDPINSIIGFIDIIKCLFK